MNFQFFLIICVNLFVISRVNCIIANDNYHNNYNINNGNQNNDYVPIIENGVPIDTPEVQAAKAAHFEAYARAAALAAKQPSNGQYYQQNKYTQHYQQQPFYGNQQQRQQYHHQQRYRRDIHEQHIPKIINGVPEETSEVQLAKYQHYLARKHLNDNTNDNGLIQENSYYNDGYYHIPIIGKNGVPIETKEVQLARKQHLLAYYLTKNHQQYANNYGYSKYLPIIGPNGIPYDTPEVQLARAQHISVYFKQ